MSARLEELVDIFIDEFSVGVRVHRRFDVERADEWRIEFVNELRRCMACGKLSGRQCYMVVFVCDRVFFNILPYTGDGQEGFSWWFRLSNDLEEVLYGHE